MIICHTYPSGATTFKGVQESFSTALRGRRLPTTGRLSTPRFSNSFQRQHPLLCCHSLWVVGQNPGPHTLGKPSTTGYTTFLFLALTLNFFSSWYNIYEKKKKISERNGGFVVIHQLIVPFYQLVTVKIKRSISQDCSMHQVLSSIPESHVYTKK